MANQVVSGAQLACSFGSTPGSLTVLPANQVNASQMPAATVMDHKPMSNIGSFGMCTSLANPQVAAATSAAMGTLTPQPCIPVTLIPWTPGSPTVTIRQQVTLNNSSQCQCQWLGLITITYPGTQNVTVP